MARSRDGSLSIRGSAAGPGVAEPGTGRPARALVRAGVRDDLLVIGAYFLGTLYLLARVIPHFGTTIPGGPVGDIDGWQNVWNMWWVRSALSQGQNPFYTTMLYYPTGAELFLQTLNITNGLLTLPFQIVGGPIAAYNGAVILGFVLGGYGAYLLAMHVIGHRWIAAMVGAIFTFSPFHVTKLWDGQLEWVTLQWIPLYILCLLKAWETKRPKLAIVAGLLFALMALTSWYTALFTVVWTAVFFAVRLPSSLRSGLWRKETVTLWVAATTGALLLAPMLLPVLLGFESSSDWWPGTIPHSADLVDFLFPSHLHPVWGDFIARSSLTMRPYIWGWNISPGYAVVALAVLGGWTWWRKTHQWVISMIVLFVLALGPRLQVAGLDTGLPMPYALLKPLPGATMARRPNHFAVIALLLLALVAGFGMRWLLAHGRRGRLALMLLGVVTAAEYAVLPAPALAFHVHPIFYELRHEPGAIMDLPGQRESADPIRSQLVHGRPILGGFLARTPGYRFAQIVPGVRDLWNLDWEPEAHDIVAAGDSGRQALDFYHVKTIVLRRESLGPNQERRAYEALERNFPNLEPRYRSPEITVYDLPPLTESRPFLYLDSGWQEPEHEGERVWRWMGSKADLRIVNPGETVQPIELQLAVSSYQSPRPLAAYLDGRLVASAELTPVQRVLRIWLTLTPGEHILTISSDPEAREAEGQRDLSLSFTQIQLVETQGQ